jgi:hypothetical protein
MPPNVVNGALLSCSFGMTPSSLVVLPTSLVQIDGQPAATTMDHIPMVNIQPFGMCTSLANPTVASATAAALGVLTPMPCIPATASPWVPGAPMTQIANQFALTSGSQCMCNWGGVIQIGFPGSVTTQSS